MDELEITQPEENLESTEGTERVEQQALEDATHEPGARVEQTGDYEQAEAVENALTEAVETTEQPGATLGTQPESVAKPDEPKSQAGDPLTGKGYGQQSQNSNEGTESKEPVIADAGAPSGNFETQAQTEGVAPEQAVEQQAGDNGVDPGQIDGNDPVYQLDDQEPDVGGAIEEGVNEPIEGTSQVDPQRIDGTQLPEELLIPGAKGKGGGTKKPGSVPKSGGGSPVGGPGAGSKGNSSGFHDHDSTEGRYLFMQMIFSGNHGYVMEKDGKGVWAFEEDGFHYYEDYEIVNQTGQTFDGDTGMPYTGSHGGGENPDPDEPVGGIDREAGAFFPVYGKGGGSDSSGSTPGDKDGDDDSGKFLADGELSGDDDGTLDPGDLDYNEADQANTELKSDIKEQLE